MMQNLDKFKMRDKVNALELFAQSLPLAQINKPGQIELTTEHFFSPGIYTRVLYIPKGCILTGKIHKEPILNIMVKGDISVVLGEEVRRIKAPYIVVSPAGSKKAGYAHEDTVWVGCHGTDELDIYEIEKRFVASSEQEWLDYYKQNEQLLLEI